MKRHSNFYASWRKNRKEIRTVYFSRSYRIGLSDSSLANRLCLGLVWVCFFDQLLAEGYPNKSVILVTGSPGIGKEVLGYKFIQAGLRQSDFCLYVTRLSVREVLQDAKALGIEIRGSLVTWESAEEGQIVYDGNDLTKLSFTIKELLKKNSTHKIRIVLDVCSALLMLNPPDAIYKFLDQLFREVKQYDAVLLATLEEGMHEPRVLASLEQLFSGVIEFRLTEEGQRRLHVIKMMGIKIQSDVIAFTVDESENELVTIPSAGNPGLAAHQSGLQRNPQTAVILDKHRIAVLPFSNISPDPKDEYFADGMTEELISTLSRIRELKVISRTSIMRYRQTEKSLPEIAAELNVNTVLEGSVRKIGDELRITAQLIDIQNDEHIWSEDFDRKFENIFSLQREIALKVADSMKISILSSERKEMGKRITQNMEAYVLYLKARSYRSRSTIDSFNHLKGYCLQAIEKDPNFAQAYADLAYGYCTAAYQEILPTKEALPIALKYAQKAIQLDSSIAESHIALGWVLMLQKWDFHSAESEFRRVCRAKSKSCGCPFGSFNVSLPHEKI